MRGWASWGESKSSGVTVLLEYGWHIAGWGVRTRAAAELEGGAGDGAWGRSFHQPSPVLGETPAPQHTRAVPFLLWWGTRSLGGLGGWSRLGVASALSEPHSNPDLPPPPPRPDNPTPLAALVTK